MKIKLDSVQALGNDSGVFISVKLNCKVDLIACCTKIP